MLHWQMKKIIRQDIRSAVKEMIVGPQLEREIDKYLEMLRAYKQKAEEYYKNEHPKKVIDMVSRFVLEDKLGEMAKLYAENKKTIPQAS